jgi:branched-chain amino acid aminotransferase
MFSYAGNALTRLTFSNGIEREHRSELTGSSRSKRSHRQVTLPLRTYAARTRPYSSADATKFLDARKLPFLRATKVTNCCSSLSMRDSGSSGATGTAPVGTNRNTAAQRVGRAAVDWQSLGFGFTPTNCYVKAVWREQTGTWSPVEVVPYGPNGEATFPLHVASTALHYGQSIFEGLKAFACADGHVRLFRPQENARRLERSALRLNMPVVPAALFLEAVTRCVYENLEFVPPYVEQGGGGSLYVRPVLFGSGGRIGLGPADEYTFMVLVVPVGNYYKGGLSPVTAYISTNYDRAAPRGVGHVKVAGNYAADLKPSMEAKQRGYPINLYLDAREQKFIEEFGTSNFSAVRYLDENGNRYVYVTADSPSVLEGVTNKTLMELSLDAGMKVERRRIPVEELATFDEVFASGTAVVITAVDQIVYGDQVIGIGKHPGSGQVGPVARRLYDTVRGLQTGRLPDRHGWTYLVA